MEMCPLNACPLYVDLWSNSVYNYNTLTLMFVYYTYNYVPLAFKGGLYMSIMYAHRDAWSVFYIWWHKWRQVENYTRVEINTEGREMHAWELARSTHSRSIMVESRPNGSLWIGTIVYFSLLTMFQNMHCAVLQNIGFNFITSTMVHRPSHA